MNKLIAFEILRSQLEIGHADQPQTFSAGSDDPPQVKESTIPLTLRFIPKKLVAFEGSFQGYHVVDDTTLSMLYAFESASRRLDRLDLPPLSKPGMPSTKAKVKARIAARNEARRRRRRLGP